MIQLLYATNNEFKLQNMRDRLNNLNIEIISPKDIRINIKINESGKNVIENATIKVKAYSNICNIPIITTDSSLYVKNFKEQPGLFVKRIDGKELNSKELEKYYIEKLDEIGGKSNAYYITGIAIMLNSKIYTTTIKEDEFLFTSRKCDKPFNGDPLGRLEYDEELNKYFCELTKDDKKRRKYIFDKKCFDFIKQHIID